MKLSIFLAGIRTANWLNLYESIPNATTLTDYELVIVSPYDLPPELQNVENVRLIKDFGCPTRCYQLGLVHSQGEYVVWVADDGIFSPAHAIDKAFGLLPPSKGITCMTYFEGSRPSNNRKQSSKPHWLLGSHPTLKKIRGIPNYYFMIMVGLMKRDYLMDLGGWDCRFEQPGAACIDASVRWQNLGSQIMLGDKLQDVGHCVGVDQWGVDHIPIERAHYENDFPLLESIYRRPSGSEKIDVNNWKQAPEVWERRFPGGKV